MDKACALSGHRILKKDFDLTNLKARLYSIIDGGYNVFYIGMARGFDIESCKLLISYNQTHENKIKIIACLPCKEQDKYYSEKEKKEYRQCLLNSSEIIYTSDEYINGCMQIRNRFMIDNSEILLAYLYKNAGGTYYTCNYAKKKNKKIIFV